MKRCNVWYRFFDNSSAISCTIIGDHWTVHVSSFSIYSLWNIVYFHSHVITKLYKILYECKILRYYISWLIYLHKLHTHMYIAIYMYIRIKRNASSVGRKNRYKNLLVDDDSAALSCVTASSEKLDNRKT